MNSGDIGDWTPLHEASQNGHSKVVQSFLEEILGYLLRSSWYAFSLTMMSFLFRNCDEMLNDIARQLAVYGADDGVGRLF